MNNTAPINKKTKIKTKVSILIILTLIGSSSLFLIEVIVLESSLSSCAIVILLNCKIVTFSKVFLSNFILEFELITSRKLTCFKISLNSAHKFE
jgi:hypothetical protein